jgi:hypothetical protein
MGEKIKTLSKGKIFNKEFEIELNHPPSSGLDQQIHIQCGNIFGNQEEADFRISNFEEIRKGLNTWDFQWAYTRFINSGLSIVPQKNLVQNLGFGEDATHTHSENDRRANMDISEMKFPLKNSKYIIRDKKSDDKFFNEFVKDKSSLLRKIVKKVLKK